MEGIRQKSQEEARSTAGFGAPARALTIPKTAGSCKKQNDCGPSPFGRKKATCQLQQFDCPLREVLGPIPGALPPVHTNKISALKSSMRFGTGIFLTLALTVSVVGSGHHSQNAKRGVGANQQPRPPFKAVVGSFFALSVPDVDATTDWYSEKLGLKVLKNFRTTDGIGVAILDGGGLTLELIQNQNASAVTAAARENPTLKHGIFKVGIVIEDFDETVAELKKRGVEIPFGPFPATPDQKANAMIRDNDGNLIQLLAK
jgi:catechol 2,3-dioxygenase-like lactoylglutathione lyase family enzyme